MVPRTFHILNCPWISRAENRQMEEHSKPAIKFSCLSVNFVVVSLALVLVLVPFLDALCFRIIGIAEQIKFLSRKGFLRKILVCIIGRILTVHGSRPIFPATQARPCHPCLTSVLRPTYIEETRQERVFGCMNLPSSVFLPNLKGTPRSRRKPTTNSHRCAYSDENIVRIHNSFLKL